MPDNIPSRRIHLLREEVARRLAAGEVIDRPQAVVRELVDNSIDSGASEIEVSIRDGGVTEIRVRDDGDGMSREDLVLCVEPHATSKITEIDDLLRATTLGFRGEALSSIAASAKLSVTSRRKEGSEGANRIVVHGGRVVSFGPVAGSPGTIVTADDLFYATPARRKFLSRNSAEALRCERTLLEKSLPFPSVSFRYQVDENIKINLLPAPDRIARIAAAFGPPFDPSTLHSGRIEGERYSIEAIVTDPSYSRGDRRMIYLYVNDRRVDEYSLLQAVHYAYQPYLPGGRFPAAFVFLRVDPSEIDFNIHPAKREVRFRALNEYHHAVVEAVRSVTARFSASPVATASFIREQRLDFGAAGPTVAGPERHHTFPGKAKAAGSAIASMATNRDRETSDGNDSAGNRHRAPMIDRADGIAYFGQLFSLFLLVEKDDSLYLIDQHASHERILYDRFVASPGESQTLLVPRSVSLDASSGPAVRRLTDDLSSLGITIEERPPDGWFLTALPGRYRGMEQAIVEFIESCRGDRENLARRLYSVMACRAAVKDTDRLDDATAVELAREALALPEPRCPHGRPVWHRISRSELYSLVGRT